MWIDHHDWEEFKEVARDVCMTILLLVLGLGWFALCIMVVVKILMFIGSILF